MAEAMKPRWIPSRVRKTCLAFSNLFALAVMLSIAPLHAQDSALFSQAATATLERQFQDPTLSWLLLDRSGNMLAQHWKDSEQPIPPGSLVKPFLALAYGQQHDFVYPQVQCMGAKGKCWQPRGHGRLGLEQALAQSCNDYFLTLAGDLDRGRAMQTFQQLGLSGPPRTSADETLIGLNDRWRETPLAIALAYLHLLRDAPQPGQMRIVAGMRASAQTGTARAVDVSLGNQAAIAKTGTATCTHHPAATADGFAVVLYPADEPSLLLLVRRHGSTGAQAAANAGEMLRSLGMSSR
jgi:cell division protein FtsI/penicillin-binding protein 2